MNISSYISDFIESERPDKSLQPNAQWSVEVILTSKLTLDGQTIFDPFMGSGTTRIAALKLNGDWSNKIGFRRASFNLAQLVYQLVKLKAQ